MKLLTQLRGALLRFSLQVVSSVQQTVNWLSLLWC